MSKTFWVISGSLVGIIILIILIAVLIPTDDQTQEVKAEDSPADIFRKSATKIFGTPKKTEDSGLTGVTFSGNEASIKYNFFPLGMFKYEEELGIEAEKNMMPLQPGDVPATSADIQKSKEMLGFSPKTSIREGIHNFLVWYREYYKI